MSTEHRQTRIIIASVEPAPVDTAAADLAAAAEMLEAAGFRVVRQQVLRQEPRLIRELMRMVSGTNAADVVLLLGTGFGPGDVMCETLDAAFERKIEGFGEALRRLFRSEYGVGSALLRATAGVADDCLYLALPAHEVVMARALRELVIPLLPTMIAHALGTAQADT